MFFLNKYLYSSQDVLDMLPGPSFEDTQQLNGAIRNFHRTTEQGKVKTNFFFIKIHLEYVSH